LKESGSGIGQVLAILTVVVTSEQPRIIIIDEPQSFLHPGAITKLFRILKQDYPQHQYIVSTHSPTVITAAEPKTLLLVKKEGSESRIEQIDVKNSQSQRRFLTEIGASLADVFGADNVLWVEGATEEECYPKLLSGILSKNLMATAIVGVINTGDLEGRHHEIIKKIYDKLSDSTGLIPPAVGFIFDREKRSESEISDLKDRGIHLIPRRMYENYLLHPAAIAAHIVELDGYEGKDSLEASIQAWLDLHKWDANYFHGKVSKQSDDYWLVNVHGAQILHDIYKAHTHVDRPHSFLDNKVEYSVWLTEYLIKHEPDALRELAEFIDDVIERGREKLVAKEG
jgi:energy-coupling factor transporter ATP-binding protein EcfA2